MAKSKKSSQTKDPQTKFYNEVSKYLHDNNATIDKIIWLGGMTCEHTGAFCNFIEDKTEEELEEIFNIKLRESFDEDYDDDDDDYMEPDCIMEKLMFLNKRGFVIELLINVREYYSLDSYGSSPGHSHVEYIYSDAFGEDMFEKIKKCVDKSIERDKAKLSKKPEIST